MQATTFSAIVASFSALFSAVASGTALRVAVENRRERTSEHRRRDRAALIAVDASVRALRETIRSGRTGLPEDDAARAALRAALLAAPGVLPNTSALQLAEGRPTGGLFDSATAEIAEALAAVDA